MFSLPFELIPDNSVNKRRLPVATRQSTLGNFETCHKSGVGWYSFWEKSHFHGCKEWFIVTEPTNKKNRFENDTKIHHNKGTKLIYS